MKLWRKGYRKIIFWLFIASIILFPVYLYALNYLDSARKAENFSSAVTALIVSWAGLAALWTARETFDQKQVAQKQLGYSLRPYLRIQLNEVGSVFDIVNVGNGVAIDVRFEKTEFNDPDTKRDVSFTIKNRPLISISGVTKVSRREIMGGGLPVDRHDYNGYLRSKAYLGFKIVATYKNLKNDKFKVVFISDETYNDYFRIELQEIIKTG